MKGQNGWVLILWEGSILHGVFGSFPSREKALEAAKKEPDLRAEVVPLWRANQVGVNT